MEVARASTESEASKLLEQLKEGVSGWLAMNRSGRDESWIWAEHPAHLDLSLLCQVQQRLTPEQAVLVCLPILRALSALHRTQRVCGSLTPSAIHIDSGCQSLLGRRLIWHPHARVSSHSLFRVEEVSYWSPERFVDPDCVTPQADMWAFGLILYQLLCGGLPWGSTTQLTEQVKLIQCFNTEEALKKSPSTLRSFLARCLTHDLDHRWSHATQALEALSEVAENTSPLLKGQRLSEQWTVLMEVDGPQRFIEETAIIPTMEPEEDLARFVQVRVDLDDLASPHIDALTLKPLFPKLSILHERWWSNQAMSQEAETQQSSSLESFRLSLSNIAPEFLFEQLTLLSKQKESLEIRFQERIKRLKREREMIRDEVRQHTRETLISLWSELGLPEDLIPNLSLEAAAHRGAKRSTLAKAPRNQPIPIAQPAERRGGSLLSAEPEEVISNFSHSVTFRGESPQNQSGNRQPAYAENKTAMEFALSESIGTSSKGVMNQGSTHDKSVEVESSLAERVRDLSQGNLERAEAALREEVFSTPPLERLEKLSELGAMKREIELSQPMMAVSPPPPEWSSPPEWDSPPLVVTFPPSKVQRVR